MNNNTLIEQLEALEKEGITVTIGEGATFMKKGKSINMHWSNLQLWKSAPYAGAFSESVAFDNYADLPKVLSETITKFKAKIATFLAGSGI